jgi:basic membrane protein A
MIKGGANMFSKKVGWLLTILVTVTVVLSACGTPEATQPPAAEATQPPAAEKLKVAFIYIGQPGDLGWTYEHERGRQMLIAQLGEKVETIAVPDVPEGPDAEKAIRDVVQQGAKVVFATSFGYMDPMVTVAQEFPDVYFEHCSGYKTAPNMSNYFGRIEQPRYLSGIVAGSMTTSNIIGYVAAFPIPEVVRGINSFTLGVRSVNPQAEVRVVWTSTWYDPVKEREGAVALLDAGADIIAQHQDTTEPQKAAQERGKLSVGYDSDMSKFVGDTVLTSPVWNWGTYYVQTVQAILDKTWTTHSYWGGMKEGVVELAPLSAKVPPEVVAKVDAAKQQILSGNGNVFCGPINDQSGAVKVPEGQCVDDAGQLSMDWFVEGVVGTIPK